MTEPTARVVADSISRHNNRVTTMEVTMHRFVLAEFNTHRVFSRNSASSRAIPVQKQIDRGVFDRAFPVSLPAEQPGMQGGTELTGVALRDAERVLEDIWGYTCTAIQNYLSSHPDAGQRLHKSILNRPMEWFQWHTVIVTSTEWSNFFALRCHELAQPEIRVAAEIMRDAYMASTPTLVPDGSWHLPYVEGVEGNRDDLEHCMKASVARCAWVSTMGHDQDRSWEAIERMYDRLASANPMHASPFEHQCMPAGIQVPEDHLGNLRGWKQLRHMIEVGAEPWTK